MESIYAVLYTSDPYEPSGVIGLFRTKEEYVKIKFDEEYADLKQSFDYAAYRKDDKVGIEYAQDKLKELEQLTEEDRLNRYFIDLNNEELLTQMTIDRLIVKIPIGKFDHYS